MQGDEDRVVRSPHTRIYLHLVWSTWDRAPLITSAIEARLHGALVARCASLGGFVLAVGGIEDHVHMLVRIPPALSIAALVGDVKGGTSHLVNAEIAPDRRFRWQGAYGARSVCPNEVDKVRRYVLGQREHHERGTVRAEWERTDELR